MSTATSTQIPAQRVADTMPRPAVSANVRWIEDHSDEFGYSPDAYEMD